MKLFFYSKWLFLVLVFALVSTAASLKPPSGMPKDYTFDVSSAYGDRDSFSFTVSESGCIIAQVQPWSRSGTSRVAASELALILNGSDRTGYYARVDGGSTNISPLWTSYTVTSTQISKVKTWTISVVNFTKSGSAKGTLSLESSPTQTPCELKIVASRTKGQVDLSWLYSGKPFKGSFIIERSTDGKTWTDVGTCKKPAPSKSTTSSMSYDCSDTGLKSKTIYYYRGCAITSGSKCGTSNITPATKVKIP